MGGKWVLPGGEAINGKNALDQLKDHRIDIAIVDINMPVMDGLTFMQRAREQGYQGEFVVLSSYDEFEFVKKAMVLGARDYIHKPTLTPDSAMETLNRVKKEILLKKQQERMMESSTAFLLEQMVSQGILKREWSGEQISNNFCWTQNLKFCLYVLQIPDRNGSRFWEYCVVKAEKRMEEFRYQHRKNMAVFQDGKMWVSIFISDRLMKMEWKHCLEELEEMGLSVIVRGTASPVGPELLYREYQKAKTEAEEEVNRLKWENTLSSLVLEVVEDIRSHYREDITLEKTVKKYHVNYSYFSRLFYKEVGECFTDYVTRIRMEQAKFLLLTTDFTISQVAEQSGYENEKYFMKLFKKTEGCTPSEYRRLKNISENPK